MVIIDELGFGIFDEVGFGISIRYLTLLTFLLVFISCLIAYNLLEDLLVNGVISRAEILFNLLNKLLIVVMDSFIQFNLVCLKSWYHGQLVLLQVDFG